MSVLMKMPPTEEVEVTVNDATFAGPSDNVGRLLSTMERLNFRRVVVEGASSDHITWDEVAKERISKYGLPGLALRGARARENFTQAQLAKKLGIPQYNISKMENGKRPIGKNMSRRLARIFNCDYRLFL